MTRLLISFTLIATLLLGCAGQSNSARPAADGEGFATDTEGPTQGPGNEAADVDESGEQAQEVDAENTDTPLGESLAQPLPEPLTGTFGIEDIEGGCPYLEVEGQRFELIAGDDTAIMLDADEGQILSDDGDVIAEAGDTVSVDGAIDPAMASFCQIGQILVVDSITAE